MDIGQILKTLRSNKGHTLKEAASLAKIGFSHLSEIERGRKNPKFKTVEQIILSYGYEINISFTAGNTQHAYTSKVDT